MAKKTNNSLPKVKEIIPNIKGTPSIEIIDVVDPAQRATITKATLNQWYKNFEVYSYEVKATGWRFYLDLSK